MRINSNISERRKQTRSKIYRALYDSPHPLSKQDLSAKLGLSLPTVYQNITELMDLQLIEYAGSQLPRGGRPAMQMRVVANARYAIGSYISMHSISFVVVNLLCGVSAHKKLQNNLPLFTDVYNRFFTQELESFIDENNIDRQRLLGVGICLSGIINSDSSTIFYAPTLGLRNVSMKPLIDAIPYPVHPENDAICGGFAEWFIEAGGDNLAYLSLTRGVGGALFVNGDKYLGSNQRSGEFGHMCVERDGLPCTCGKRGCFEAYCSSSRISSALGLTLDEFFQKLNDGDMELKTLWDDYMQHLAIGIHNIRMALDCRIIVGDEMSEFIAPHLPRLRRLVADCDPFSDEADYLSVGHYSGKGALLGSALFFVKMFLDSNI